jgi:hypothetical protein
MADLYGQLPNKHAISNPGQKPESEQKCEVWGECVKDDWNEEFDIDWMEKEAAGENQSCYDVVLGYTPSCHEDVGDDVEWKPSIHLVNSKMKASTSVRSFSAEGATDPRKLRNEDLNQSAAGAIVNEPRTLKMRKKEGESSGEPRIIIGTWGSLSY